VRIDVMGVLVRDPTKLGWRAKIGETYQRSMREKWEREKLKRWRRLEAKLGWRAEMGETYQRSVREKWEHENLKRWRRWKVKLGWRAKWEKCIRKVCKRNGSVRRLNAGESGRRALIWWEVYPWQSNGFIGVSYLIRRCLRCRKRSRFEYWIFLKLK